MARFTGRAGVPDHTEHRSPWLAGGGEMGELVRSIDWASTPLGPVEAWPMSLKTTVGLVLRSAFPTLLWWGDELIQIYNDAYRPVLGDKHPASMGAAGSEVWSEIWDILGPLAAKVRSGGGATWHEHLLLPMNRKGFVEETYFTFSYSPVLDDHGGIGGVLVTCQETTAEVQDARQLRTLRDLAARSTNAQSAEEALRAAAAAFGANDADVPFAFLYLLDDDGEAARLVEAVGLKGPGGAGELDEMALRRGDVWPLADARGAQAPVEVRDLCERAGTMPRGRWDVVPEAAVVAPLARAGQSSPYGFLVSGLSPMRVYDASYAGFFRLAADQIAGAIASARAREEERRRVEELTKIDRAKTAFFSNVSHEFRTPLTLILGPVEDALRREHPISGPELEAVHRNALRLLKLVGSLLDFARMEAGRMQARYEPTDLGAVTAELASGFRSAAERAGLRLTVRHDSLEEPAYVDRGMWEKIVLNLMSNALKFTFEGGIEVAVTADDESFILQVRDSGVGVPERELPHLFERFHRVEGTRARTQEGAGIGLALASEFAALHGGTIDAQSAVGRGSTFEVRIPRGSAHLPADRVVARSSSAASNGESVAAYMEEVLRWMDAGGSAPVGVVPPLGAETDRRAAAAGRVLIADDNADMRDYLARLLRAHWTVEVVSDGAAALAAARERPPDLALIDVMMPEMNGFELLRALRADRRTRLVPVIMLSARAGEEAQSSGIEAGADDYIVKPFAARELVARISAHMEVGRLRLRLDREREGFERLFDQAPVPIAVLRGSALAFELANQAYCRVIGRGDILGKPLLEVMPEIEGQEFVQLLRDVIETGAPHVGQEALVRLDRSGSGELEDTYFTFVYAPITGRGGRARSVAVICNDVTEQVRARKEMERLAMEAAEANRAKDDFLAMLGHELRNPLSPILTALQLMSLRGTKTREQAVIERQVGHLVRLVDDLLDVSGIKRGKIALHRRRLEICEVVRRAVETAEPLFDRGGHRVEIQVPPRGLGVEVDPDRMTQVIANLLTNAAKYSEEGSRIEITAERSESSVRVKVKDEGVGLEPDAIEEVFELFNQQRQSIDRAKGGLGLGLTIARSLVELHGGRITAASEGPGRGSEFSIELPWVDLTADVERGAELAEREHTSSQRQRVLVVDDNRDFAGILVDALLALGHDVEVAYDGPSALEVASRFAPDAALLDIGLPVMDGHELAQKLREEHGDLRLIAVTGYGRDVDHRRSRESGFRVHLVKPVALADITRALDDGRSEEGNEPLRF